MMQQAIFEDLDIEDPTEFILASNQYTRFAEKYFVNPDNLDEPLILETGQKQVINALQFGYDVESTPDDYINTAPPKGVVMCWPRQTGKTTGVCAFCATVLCLDDKVKIGVIAQAEGTAKEIVRRVKIFLKNSLFDAKVEKYQTMEIHMKNGGVLRAHPSSDSIRGFSYNYLIVDEAAQIDDKIIRDAAIHTTRKIGIRWCLLSTPDGPKGLLIKNYKQGLKTRRVICKRCLTEFTQAHFEAKYDALFVPPGLPACPECGYYEEDESDEEGRSWGNTYFYGMGDYTVISVDPFKCSFYPKDEILDELERGGWSPKLRQELLGEIITEGNSMYEEAWVDRALHGSQRNTMEKKENISYVVSVDFGKVHDNSVIMVLHEEDGKAVLDYMRIIFSRYAGKEYNDIKNEIVEIVMFYNPETIIPDATGMGEPVVEMMEKDLNLLGWYGKIYCNKKNRLGFIFDVKSKPDLMENLQQYFARNKMILPNRHEPHMDVLINELLSFSYEHTKTNYIKYGVQTEHDDTVITLALGIWGLRFKPWISPEAIFTQPRGRI